MTIKKINYNKSLKSGFSIIEIIISISVLGIIIASTITIFTNRKNITMIEEARASIIQILEQAQNQSATGVGDSSHGVRIENNKIITFSGNSYLGEGSEITLPYSISTDKSDLTIIFDRLNAKPNTNTVIKVNHISGITRNITITSEGLILDE